MKSAPLALAALAALFALLAYGMFFTVDQRERVLLFQLGEIRGADFKPGLHVKIPLVQHVVRFDGRLVGLDNQTENLVTADKKNVEVGYYVKWRIDDPATYYRATGGEDLNAGDMLASILNRGLRDAFGSRTVQQVGSGDGEDMLTALRKSAEEQARQLGIAIVDVRIKSVDLPKTGNDTIYERMRADRTRIASDLRARGAEEAEKLKAEADREAQVTVANAYRDSEALKGDGDAKASEIYAQAYGQDEEFYRFYRSLNVYRDAFATRDNVMVLEPKGELFQYFKHQGGGK